MRNSKPQNCAGCPLNDRPLVDTEIHGSPPEVWFVGEAPGYEEVREGRPFVGKAGRVLRKALTDIGWNIPYLITNACLCHPDRNKTPSKKAIEACRWHLAELSQRYPKPGLIVALGQTAAKSLGVPAAKLDDLRGKVFQTIYGPCFVMYHPSRVLRSEHRLKHAFTLDLRKALHLAKAENPLSVSSKTLEDYRSRVEVIETESEAVRFIRSIPTTGLVACDVETSVPLPSGEWADWGLNPYHPKYAIYSISFAFNDRAWAVKTITPEVKEALRNLFLTHRNFVAHNAKFESIAIKRLLNADATFQHDTQILAHLLNESMQGFYSLETLVSFYTPVEDYKHLKNQDLFVYNALDSLFTLELCNLLLRELQSRPERAHLMKAERFVLSVVIPLLVEVELNGIGVNHGVLNLYRYNLERTISILTENLERLTGVKNPRSNAFRDYLANLCTRGGIKLERTETGLPSISTEVLEELLHATKSETVRKIVLYKLTHSKISKIYDSYVKPYPEFVNPYTGRIHPSYKQTGTRTGRLSCENPNFQQVPREGIVLCPDCHVLLQGDRCPLCGGTDSTQVADVNRLFMPAPGHVILSVDYSQMEVRILAHETQDPALMKAIKEGLDLHSYTASKIFDVPYEEILARKSEDPEVKRMRSHAKSATFGIIYGITPQGLAEQTGLSVDEAKDLIEKFFQTYPEVKRWVEKVHRFVQRNHWYATPTGRVRHFETLDGKELREAQNFPIQSFASDLTLHGAWILHQRFQSEGIRARIVGLVHDSVKIEVHRDDLERAKELIHRVLVQEIAELYRLTVPLEIDLEVHGASEVEEPQIWQAPDGRQDSQPTREPLPVVGSRVDNQMDLDLSF